MCVGRLNSAGTETDARRTGRFPQLTHPGRVTRESSKVRGSPSRARPLRFPSAVKRDAAIEALTSAEIERDVQQVSWPGAGTSCEGSPRVGRL